MNDQAREMVRAQLWIRYRFLMDRNADEVVDEVYAWAWVHSAGRMDRKSIDKACRTQAKAMGWTRRIVNRTNGAWYRRERCSAGIELASTNDRVAQRSNGPCVPRVRNARFKQLRHVPKRYAGV